MARAAFARISASAFAAIFGVVVILMISGLVLTDRAFGRLHREVARADGLQAILAIGQGRPLPATPHSAFLVIQGQDTTRWPPAFAPRGAPETVMALPRSAGTLSVFVTDHS